MEKRILGIIGVIIVASFLWFISTYYPGVYLYEISLSLFAIAIVYIFIKYILGDVVFKQIKDDKTRYTANKVSSILFLIVILIILIRVWSAEVPSLILSLGVIGAGIAIALQDVLKNFVGGFIILTGQPYEVGDRIEIAGESGDVIDIGVMSTTLLEIGGWVHGDQPTGRVTIIPNGRVLTQHVHNYTKDHSFIWEELTISLTFDSDWQQARDIILTIVRQEVEEITKMAEDEIGRLGEKYYFPKKSVEPSVYITPMDNWITLHVRFVTSVKGRRALRNKVYSLILKRLQESKAITFASSTPSVIPVSPPDI